VTPTTREAKGDFRPIVFILTDGDPTDPWREAAEALKAAVPRPTLLSVACGDEADLSVLRELSGDVVDAGDLTAEAAKALFAWVSASVASSVKATPEAPAGEPAGGGIASRLPSGAGLTLVKLDDRLPAKAPPRLYLHVTCPSGGGRYLAVFRSAGPGSPYAPAGAHKLPEDFLKDGPAPGRRITGVEFTGGNPPCPYCGSRRMFFCQRCGSVACMGDRSDSVWCPGCRTLYETEPADGAMDIDPSVG
jgi:hypothetical protein